MRRADTSHSASNMKVLVLLACAVSCASASAVAWPGAIPVSSPHQKTVLAAPAHTKTVAYSTAQYLNALPVSYQYGLRPQLAYQYQFPQYAPVAPFQPAYYPITGAAYFPGSIYYPSAPVAPVGVPSYPEAPIASIVPGQPQQPVHNQPTPPEQSTGDSDSSVVDSAEFPQDQSTPFPGTQQEIQQPNQDSNTQSPQDSPSPPQAPQGSPSFPQFPPGSPLPSFPQFPQGSDQPQFPQFPQFPQGEPQFPQFPQFPQGSGPPQFPQFPQGSDQPQFPQYPQFPPSFPQSPTPEPPSNFPSADNSDKGVNDEDTISVESA